MGYDLFENLAYFLLKNSQVNLLFQAFARVQKYKLL